MSNLLKDSEKFRKEITVKNSYGETNRYSSSHKDAISDGDDKGKNENGSKTDIDTRKTNIIKNTYNDTKTYPDF